MGRKKDPLQKENIIKTAFRLFLKEGYKSVTISKIMSETGLSKGAIYHYFKSKEEIYQATLERYYFNMLGIDISPMITGEFKEDIRIIYSHIADLFSGVEVYSFRCA